MYVEIELANLRAVDIEDTKINRIFVVSAKASERLTQHSIQYNRFIHTQWLNTLRSTHGGMGRPINIENECSHAVETRVRYA